MWFLNEKVPLTKYNFSKHNWHGCQKYCFCDSVETTQHLFLSCTFAKIIWRMIYFTHHITPPTSITNMFGNWLNGMERKNKARICVRVSALCWSIWTCQNNIIFNKQSGSNFLYIISLAAHWIHLWSLLLPVDQREPMLFGCNRLLRVTQDFYFRATGWQHTKNPRWIVSCCFSFFVGLYISQP